LIKIIHNIYNEENPFSGILFFIIIIFSALLLRNTVNTSDNKVAKDILLLAMY